MIKRFVSQTLENCGLGELIDFPQDIRHHALVVSRLKTGDTIEISGGGKFIATACIEGEKIRIQSMREIKPRDRRIEVAISLIKLPRFEWFLEKAAEFGVDSIQPLICQRTVIQMNGESWEKKRPRFEKILMEGGRQSLAEHACDLRPPLLLGDYLHTRKDNLLVIAQPGAQTSLIDAVPIDFAGTVSLLSGPEGGFTPEEYALSLEHGALAVSLGSQILRAETAPLAMLAILRCQ